MRKEVRSIEILTSYECRALIKACKGRGLLHRRNQAIVVTLWRSGLRIAELLALRPWDVNLEEGEIRVIRGKGAKSRTVGLDPEACGVLRVWMDLRKSHGIGNGSPVFCTYRGDKLAPQYVRTLLRRKAEQAGIKKRVHPHGLRHAYAAELAKEGVPLTVIQNLLGHSNISTTNTYVAHVANHEGVSAVRNRPSWT